MFGSEETGSKKKISDFFDEWHKLMARYLDHYNAIRDQLPVCVREDFALHDCRIAGAFYEGNDLALDLDTSGAFTTITKIWFIHCPPQNIAPIINAVWICEEFHLGKSTKYKVGLLLAKGSRHAIEFVIPCDDIEVERI